MNTPTRIFARPGAPGLFSINDLQPAESWNWIAWTTVPNIRIRFNLNTATTQPDVTTITFEEYYVTKLHKIKYGDVIQV